MKNTHSALISKPHANLPLCSSSRYRAEAEMYRPPGAVHGKHTQAAGAREEEEGEEEEEEEDPHLIPPFYLCMRWSGHERWGPRYPPPPTTTTSTPPHLSTYTLSLYPPQPHHTRLSRLPPLCVLYPAPSSPSSDIHLTLLLHLLPPLHPSFRSFSANGFLTYPSSS